MSSDQPRRGALNRRSWGWLGLVLILTGWLTLAAGEAPVPTTGSAGADRPPAIFPDYTGVVIPPNLAPLNFRMEEEGEAWQVRLAGDKGEPIELQAESSSVVFPLAAWRRLLAANVGGDLRLDIRGRRGDGVWVNYATVTNRVAREPIDNHLVYRLLRPAYNLYGKLGIYQRDLEDYRETPILENDSFDGGCVNCHTFNQNRPDTMALHIRLNGSGNPMLLARSNEVAQVAKTAGYLSWHPSGRLLAYSSNRFKLFYHTVGETRDLYDAGSDLGIYWVDRNEVVVPPGIAQSERLENWPAWSPDGRHLYFCSAPRLRFERWERLRYDLMRVAFDLPTETWGEPELLVSAAELRLSANEPRVSPDGRSVLCCMTPNGNFPPYEPESDLYLYDVERRSLRALEINGDQCDSYPGWSSNGRWIVFSSKRHDHLFSRPYFSHLDDQGRFSKPLLLPQRDPTFYDSFIKTYNRPELVTGRVEVGAGELVQAIYHPQPLLRPASGGDESSVDQPFMEVRGGPAMGESPVR